VFDPTGSFLNRKSSGLHRQKEQCTAVHTRLDLPHIAFHNGSALLTLEYC